MDVTSWLASVLALFSDTMDAAMSVPALRLFLVFSLFLMIVGLFAFLVRQSRRS